jgi:hypothetical protein
MQIKHPENGVPIEGTVLPAGTRLGGRDYYASTNGTWQPFAGPKNAEVPTGDHVVWVRIPDLMTLNEALGKVRPPMFRDDSGFSFG